MSVLPEGRRILCKILPVGPTDRTRIFQLVDQVLLTLLRTRPVNHVVDRSTSRWTVPLLVRGRQALDLVATRLPAVNLLSA